MNYPKFKCDTVYFQEINRQKFKIRMSYHSWPWLLQTILRHWRIFFSVELFGYPEEQILYEAAGPEDLAQAIKLVRSTIKKLFILIIRKLSNYRWKNRWKVQIRRITRLKQTHLCLVDIFSVTVWLSYKAQWGDVAESYNKKASNLLVINLLNFGEIWFLDAFWFFFHGPQNSSNWRYLKSPWKFKDQLL